MNKKGFTLVELIVYMAIIGVVVIVAGQAFSDSTRTRVRTQNMIKASGVAEQTGMLLRDDMAQMGARSSINATTSRFERMAVAVSEEDGSAFVYEPNIPVANYTLPDSALATPAPHGDKKTDFDRITMLRVVNNDDGSYKRLEEVSWYVRDYSLYRLCKTKHGTADDGCPSADETPAPIEVAEDVTKFKITPATPDLLGGNQEIFPATESGDFRLVSRADATRNIVSVSVSPRPDESATSEATLSGFITNYKENPSPGGGSGDVVYHQAFVLESGSISWHWYDCARISLMKGATYEISFSMPVREDASRMFRPGLDHFAVGIRDANQNEFKEIPDVPDVLVYPPETNEGKGVRRMRFSSKIIEDQTNVCIAFTFATFSPLVGTGSLTISNLKVKKIADDNYRFNSGYNPDLEDKPYVRAFKVDLQVNRGGESGEVSLVVPVPNNGLKEE